MRLRMRCGNADAVLIFKMPVEFLSFWVLMFWLGTGAGVAQAGWSSKRPPAGGPRVSRSWRVVGGLRSCRIFRSVVVAFRFEELGVAREDFACLQELAVLLGDWKVGDGVTDDAVDGVGLVRSQW